MDKIRIGDKTFRSYLSYEYMQERIDAVADKMNAAYAGSDDAPILLCILNGAIMFASELMKRLSFTLELRCLKITSYVGTESTGVDASLIRLPGDFRGRRVIICEDIVDTGNTVIALEKALADAGASGVEVCTMLLKPEIFKNRLPLEYVALEIPNEFILGFGLDYDELGRNTKDIYILDK